MLVCTGSPVSMAVWLDGWEVEKPCTPLAAKGVGARIWGPSMLLSPLLDGYYLRFSRQFYGWVETKEKIDKKK